MRTAARSKTEARGKPDARGRKVTAIPRSHGRKSKVPAASLHSQGVAVSVDERVEDLIRRYPALGRSLGVLVFEGKKRIRDFPPAEQLRILRMVLALKKASGG
ncbi:MAG: hypothetical protein EXQ56_07325 [Acidobacteria bacterium]|nr:hypothetical protein [Acidobacteriota bacterium]